MSQTNLTTMKPFGIIASLGFAITLMIAASCGGEGNKKPELDFEKADSLPVDYLNNLTPIRITIQSTAELFQLLNSSGTSFDDSPMMSTGKSSGMSGERKQAMALGAYGSDAVYCTSFGQTQGTNNCLGALNDLSGKLSIQSAFDENLMTQLADSEDSTINKSITLTRAYQKAKENLFNEKRAQIATYMAVGGWIEGLYIASSVLSEESIKNDMVRQKFLSLCQGSENLMKMMAVFEADGDMKELKTEFEANLKPVNFISERYNKFRIEHVREVKEAMNAMRNKFFN